MESLLIKRKGTRSACSLARSLHEPPATRKRTYREPKPHPEKKPSSGGDDAADDVSARGGVVMTASPASGRGAPESPGRGLKWKLGCIESATSKRLESEYKLGGEIGEGKFGSIWICRAKARGEEFACKALPKNGEETVHHEVEIMQHLSGHPGVVTLKAVFEDADKFYLIMELCSGSGLLDEMAREGRFSEKRAAIVIKDLMAVVKYCHEMVVVHRDIKSENILLTKAGTMKLANLGLAARVTNGSLMAAGRGINQLLRRTLHNQSSVQIHEVHVFFRFRPRILIDVSRINMATNVLGFNISMPIMIAPSAMQKMAHPEGELATARAAASAGTIMTLSSWSTSSVEEVNSVGPGIRFFQLYVYKDRNIVRQLVKRAEMAGFKAIALTVDTPRLGRREADIKNRFTLPPHLVLKYFEALDLGKIDRTKDSGLTSYVASQTDQSLSWKDIKWLQTITSLPILVKGVMTAEDTRLAIECGADGIIVSNHGARQLDYVPATISCLEEVVREAKGRIPVFLDGGVRRGTDVFKALALGASGVFIGRPVLFSLAVDGEAGVRKVLQMLRDELELTMALSGCTSLKEITRNHVITESDRIRRSRL